MPPVYDVRARQPTPQQQRDEIGDCVIVERPQQRRAAAVLISEGRQAQVHALARIALRLPIQRLVLAVLSNRTMMPKECRIEEGLLLPDHVHMMISISLKYAALHVVGWGRVRAVSVSASSGGDGLII